MAGCDLAVPHTYHNAGGSEGKGEEITETHSSSIDAEECSIAAGTKVLATPIVTQLFSMNSTSNPLGLPNFITISTVSEPF